MFRPCAKQQACEVVGRVVVEVERWEGEKVRAHQLCGVRQARLGPEQCEGAKYKGCAPCKGYDLRNYLHHFGFDTYRATHHHEWFYMKAPLLPMIPSVLTVSCTPHPSAPPCTRRS